MNQVGDQAEVSPNGPEKSFLSYHEEPNSEHLAIHIATWFYLMNAWNEWIVLHSVRMYDMQQEIK